MIPDWLRKINIVRSNDRFAERVSFPTFSPSFVSIHITEEPDLNHLQFPRNEIEVTIHKEEDCFQEALDLCMNVADLWKREQDRLKRERELEEYERLRKIYGKR